LIKKWPLNKIGPENLIGKDSPDHTNDKNSNNFKNIFPHDVQSPLEILNY